MNEDHNTTLLSAVSDDSLKHIVSLAATITTIALAFTGIPLCLQFWKKGTVGDVSSAPFVAGATNGIMWLRYGYLVHDFTIKFVNFWGALMQTLYICCYYKYCSDILSMKQLRNFLLASMCLVVPTIGYVDMYAVDWDEARYFLGTICSTLAVVFCAAPLIQMGEVIRSKSTETMSFTMSLMTFLMAVLWFMYGILISDYFVQVPNFLGACFGAMQLCLYYFYPRSASKIGQSPRGNISI